ARRHATLVMDGAAADHQLPCSRIHRISCSRTRAPFAANMVVIKATSWNLGSVLILASIVRRYRVDADPTHVPKVVGRVTVRSGNGVRVRLHRR
ncbi:hypothetical protein ACUXG4_002722, partial [Cupriavidus metallidurans]